MRASVCGGMFAVSHMSMTAKPMLPSWLVTRATLWSEAENSVTMPTPTMAAAQAKSIVSMRRVSTSQKRETKFSIDSSPLRK